MPCNRLAYRTASCRSKLGTSTLMAEAKALAGYPRTHPHHLTTHGIYANALGLFLSVCLFVLCHEDRGARAMRDAGYAHRRGEGARSDQQPPAANHCQLASQPKELWGSKSRAVANGAEKPPPPFRCGSGTTAVTSSSLLDPACARCGYLRAPLAVSRPCAFAPCLVREGEEEKKEVKKIVGAYQILPFFLTLLSQCRGVAPVTLPHL